MKILYVILDAGIPLHGAKGASAHVRALAAALAEIGHDITVVARNTGGPEPLLPDNIRVISISPEDSIQALASRSHKSSNELSALFQNSDDYRAIINLVQKERPDAILERLSLFSLAPLAVSKSLGLPFLLEVNAPLSDEAATYRGLGLYDTARLVERIIIRGADVVLPVSTALRDWVVSEGAAAERVHVLPNGVDTRRFDPMRAKERRKDFGFEGAHVFGFIGGLRPWHGLRLLMLAFDLIAARDSAARLLVVGDGPGREDLERWRTGSPSGDRVAIVGHVPQSDVPDFLATMDIVFVPYENTSNFYFSPLKVLESMSMGRPIVAASIGDIPQLLMEGRAGEIVSPGDAEALATAAESLIKNPDLAAKMGEEARKFAVSYHDWRGVARKVEECVRAVKVTSH